MATAKTWLLTLNLLNMAAKILAHQNQPKQPNQMRQ